MSRRCLMLYFMIACAATGSLTQAAETPLDELFSEVREYRSKTHAENRQREQRFLAERALQQKRLAQIKELLEAEQQRSEHLQQGFGKNEARLAELNAKLQERSGVLLELFGHAKQAAGDTQAILRDSLIATQYQDNKGLVAKLAVQKTVPSITDLEDLWFALQQEMTESGKVVSYQAPVVGEDGLPRDQRVTRVGVFNAVSEGHYLRYLPETGTLREMPRQPGREHLRLAAQLQNAAAGLQPMTIDPSRGAVLGLLMQTPDLLERIQQGKAVGYVIIVLGLVGGLLALERLFHLSLTGQRIRKQLSEDEPNLNNPLGRVMRVYRDNTGVDTETLELMLDEAVLKDLPRLHRGLPTLKILAAVAPLLGLLGTVVGLIETFQSITLFGTGDPKLMAGGISQALVTTVLGLAAAIPLILLHSGLSSKSHRLVSVLEEQSAGIVARHAERRDRDAAVT